MGRVVPVVSALCAAGVRVSVDTTRALVAEQAISAGATMVNDVSGGLADSRMMDVLARSFSPGLTAALGQSLVIDNRPSAGSVVGADLVAKSPPDGYTLLVTGSSNVVSSLLYKKLPYHQDS